MYFQLQKNSNKSRSTNTSKVRDEKILKIRIQLEKESKDHNDREMQRIHDEMIELEKKLQEIEDRK